MRSCSIRRSSSAEASSTGRRAQATARMSSRMRYRRFGCTGEPPIDRNRFGVVLEISANYGTFCRATRVRWEQTEPSIVTGISATDTPQRTQRILYLQDLEGGIATIRNN